MGVPENRLPLALSLPTFKAQEQIFRHVVSGITKARTSLFSGRYPKQDVARLVRVSPLQPPSIVPAIGSD